MEQAIRHVGRHSAMCLLCAGAMFLSAVSLSGCATDDGQAKVGADGVRYGVTKGTFRGRWWNYYERGCSYLDGGFAQDAERDLRAALEMRSEDQLWSRTYGLHFLPEYFPHRELGIALFRQGRLPEAIEELERSVQQRYSARGLYFLNTTRRQLLAQTTGLSLSPPRIEIEGPKQGMSVSGTHIEVRGIVHADAFTERIRVNNSEVPLYVSAQDTPFATSIDLAPGENDVRVDAVDLLGTEAHAVVHVVLDVDGPAVCFAAKSPLVVTAHDPASIAYFRVDGIDVAPKQHDSVSATFVCPFSRDESRPLAYECADRLGNTTKGTLPTREDDSKHAAALLSRVQVASRNGVAALLPTADATHDQGLHIRLPDLRDGQRYLMDEIVVNVFAESSATLSSVQLNGVALPIVNAVRSQEVSHRLRLTNGSNVIVATATDAAGNRAETRVTVERANTTVERTEERLSLAILGNIPNGTVPFSEEVTRFINEELPGRLARSRRFTIVDRRLLPTALAEQELSAVLGSREKRLELGKVVPADIMLGAWIRRDADSVEIVLDGASTQTGACIVPRIEVAGPATQLPALISDLALRTVQEFPRVQGEVRALSGDEVCFTLSERDRIIVSAPCLVFAYGDPILDPVSGQTLGRETHVLGQAWIDRVGHQGSTATIVQRDAPPLHDREKQALYVITK